MLNYRYNHLHTTSSNPQKAVEFYIKNFGARVTRQFTAHDQPAWDLDLGGLPAFRINGNTGADEALKTRQAAKVTMRPQFGLHHLSLTVDNLAEAIKDLKSKGVEFVLDPTLVGSGPTYIKGPDDILIELSQAPKQG
jgi:catechol 2,3-dioxygenase-like lactoylglutathione lyase family enzyme